MASLIFAVPAPATIEEVAKDCGISLDGVKNPVCSSLHARIIALLAKNIDLIKDLVGKGKKANDKFYNLCSQFNNSVDRATVLLNLYAALKVKEVDRIKPDQPTTDKLVQMWHAINTAQAPTLQDVRKFMAERPCSMADLLISLDKAPGHYGDLLKAISWAVACTDVDFPPNPNPNPNQTRTRTKHRQDNAG
ncbi:MAG TPA: hypothetical protein VH325_03530 [Bryobacteraceae bacterium]|jgi:hypothetical protein|nr:hypothetical protein [Bryobacteraceae bacterium]